MASITTIMNVNTRIGPGMVYDIKTQVRRATTLEYDQYIPDESKTMWYHTNKGWICGKYVSLGKDVKSKIDSENKMFNAQLFEGEEAPGGETQESTAKTQTPAERQDITEMIGLTEKSIGEGTDIFLGRRIFGVPYQYLDTTDIRLSKLYNAGGMSDGDLGYNFHEAICECPILSVLPGTSMFLPDASQGTQQTFTEYIKQSIAKMSTTVADMPYRVLADEVENKDNPPQRLFAFEPNYTRFARYFNTLCQMNAIFMGLGNEYMPGEPRDKDHSFRYYDWTSYTLANKFAGRATNNPYWADLNGQIMDSTTLTNQVKDKLGNMLGSFKHGDNDGGKSAAMNHITAQYYTDFIIDPNVGYSDNLQNSVGPSMISQLFGSASDMSKEVGFLMNSSDTYRKTSEAAGEMASKAMQSVGSGIGGSIGEIIKKIGSGVSTVVSGANMVFPDIWKMSSYTQNYSIEIHLSTPYGTPRNIFLDILVPMWFWITLAAPRQATANSYMSPFLVRCHVPGMFSIDMGLVTSLTIQKAGDNSAWSIDGFPLDMKLTIQIQDLYKNLMISSINGVTPTDAWNFLWNTCLIDYVSVQSGLDMRTNEWRKKADVAASLVSDAIDSTYQYPLQTIRERLGSIINSLRL
jgi:hypothetical protein